jgi:CHASE3 domain sensor protein
METARRGRLLSDDPAFNQLFDTALASALADLDSVERKTADNPDQPPTFATCALLTDYVTAEKLERSRGKSAQAALRSDFFHDPVVMHIREIRHGRCHERRGAHAAAPARRCRRRPCALTWCWWGSPC